jgi:peptide/nickel transport system ATP-binding protein
VASAATPGSSDSRYRPTGGHRGRIATRPSSLGGRTAPPGRPAATSRPTAAQPRGGEVVLDLQDLKTYFFTYDGVVRAIDGVSFKVRRGETVGLVGETGCGKSVTAFSIDRLIGEPGRVMSGRVLFRGVDLLWGLDREARYRRIPGSPRVKIRRSYRRIKAANERMGAVRGRGIAMIFQEPSQAMNPVFTVADQLGEAILLHRGIEVCDALLRTSGDVGHGGATFDPSQELPHGGAATVDTILARPAVRAALSALVNLPPRVPEPVLRAAAHGFGEAVGLPSFATEAYYLVRGEPDPSQRQRRIARALKRVHLSGAQRSYIRYRRRLLLATHALHEVYLREMRGARAQPYSRSRARLEVLRLKLTHLYFSLWGFRRHLQRPLEREAFWRAVELLEGVRIANPVQVARGYPHELSGGMLQRAMIAMALSCEPDLLIADEPTTALDVTIQAQILELMRLLREKVGTAIVLITHDLGVVAEVCDRVHVMYAGQIVESAPVRELFRRPLHPYSQGLLASIPRLDQPDKQLTTIQGSVPNLITPPPGCRFHPRCPYAMPVCKEIRPPITVEGPEHTVACHLYGAGAEGGPRPTPTAAPSPGPSGSAPTF